MAGIPKRNTNLTCTKHACVLSSFETIWRTLTAFHLDREGALAIHSGPCRENMKELCTGCQCTFTCHNWRKPKPVQGQMGIQTDSAKHNKWSCWLRRSMLFAFLIFSDNKQSELQTNDLHRCWKCLNAASPWDSPKGTMDRMTKTQVQSVMVAPKKQIAA